MTIAGYAQTSDFLARYDARLIGDLCSDSGVQVDPTTLLTNVNLLACLSDAYGLIVSNITVGDRYTLAQLAPANMSSQGLAYLMRLTCDITLIYLKRRRGKYNEKTDGPLDKANNEALKGLQDGASILLGINDLNAQASVLELSSPQIIPRCKRNTIRYNTRNYYPVPYPYSGYYGDSNGNCGNGSCE